MKIAVVFVLLCLSLGACGQKGPLYLPQPNKPQPPAPQTQPASQVKPAPAEADPSGGSPTVKSE